MKLQVKQLILTFGFLTLMFLSADLAAAQSRLRNGVAVEGDAGSTFVSHFIRVRKGQIITVSIKRRVARGGNFNLDVSKNSSLVGVERTISGKETSTKNYLTWTRRAGSSGNYYFFLSAFPTTPYTIRVTLK